MPDAGSRQSKRFRPDRHPEPGHEKSIGNPGWVPARGPGGCRVAGGSSVPRRGAGAAACVGPEARRGEGTFRRSARPAAFLSDTERRRMAGWSGSLHGIAGCEIPVVTAPGEARGGSGVLRPAGTQRAGGGRVPAGVAEDRGTALALEAGGPVPLGRGGRCAPEHGGRCEHDQAAGTGRCIEDLPRSGGAVCGTREERKAALCARAPGIRVAYPPVARTALPTRGSPRCVRRVGFDRMAREDDTTLRIAGFEYRQRSRGSSGVGGRAERWRICAALGPRAARTLMRTSDGSSGG